MNRLSVALAIPFTMLFAAAAAAQNAPNPPPSSPPPTTPPASQPAPQTAPPSSPVPRSGATGQRDQRNPAAGQERGTPASFDQLDRTHAGYLTREGAGSDAWLSRHFQRCDADRDTRLTRAEYDACTREPMR